MDGSTQRKPPGVARQQVTSSCFAKKKATPVCRPLRGSPPLLDWSGGCGTRASRSDSPRRLPLTSLRYSAAHRGNEKQVLCALRARFVSWVSARHSRADELGCAMSCTNAMLTPIFYCLGLMCSGIGLTYSSLAVSVLKQTSNIDPTGPFSSSDCDASVNSSSPYISLMKCRNASSALSNCPGVISICTSNFTRNPVGASA